MLEGFSSKLICSVYAGIVWEPLCPILSEMCPFSQAGNARRWRYRGAEMGQAWHFLLGSVFCFRFSLWSAGSLCQLTSVPLSRGRGGNQLLFCVTLDPENSKHSHCHYRSWQLSVLHGCHTSVTQGTLVKLWLPEFWTKEAQVFFPLRFTHPIIWNVCSVFYTNDLYAIDTFLLSCMKR